MLIPLDQDLECYQGGTWDQDFDFYSDANQTVPFDFSGWTPKFVISDLQGNETVEGAAQTSSGTISVSLDSTQTEALPIGNARYYLAIEDVSVPVDRQYLMHGDFKIQRP